MKRMLYLFVAALASATAWAQTGSGTATAAAQLPGTAGFTNQFGIGYTVNDLSLVLGTMQTNFEIALPVIEAFNNSFDFANVGVGNIGVAPGSPVPSGSVAAPGANRNFSTSMGNNFANSQSASRGASVATPTTGVPSPAAGAMTTSSALTSSAQPITGFAATPITRERLRALLVLQEEMEETLSVLQGLNNDTNTVVAPPSPIAPGPLTGNFGALTNRFVTPLGNGFVTPLTPTGR
jgi:hypothetical protein